MSSESEDVTNDFQIDGRPVTKLTFYRLKSHLRRRGIKVAGLKRELQVSLCRVRNLAL